MHVRYANKCYRYLLTYLLTYITSKFCFIMYLLVFNIHQMSVSLQLFQEVLVFIG